MYFPDYISSAIRIKTDTCKASNAECSYRICKEISDSLSRWIHYVDKVLCVLLRILQVTGGPLIEF